MSSWYISWYIPLISRFSSSLTLGLRHVPWWGAVVVVVVVVVGWLFVPFAWHGTRYLVTCTLHPGDWIPANSKGWGRASSYRHQAPWTLWKMQVCQNYSFICITIIIVLMNRGGFFIRPTLISGLPDSSRCMQVHQHQHQHHLILNQDNLGKPGGNLWSGGLHHPVWLWEGGGGQGQQHQVFIMLAYCHIIFSYHHHIFGLR